MRKTRIVLVIALVFALVLPVGSFAASSGATFELCVTDQAMTVTFPDGTVKTLESGCITIGPAPTEPEPTPEPEPEPTPEPTPEPVDSPALLPTPAEVDHARDAWANPPGREDSNVTEINRSVQGFLAAPKRSVWKFGPPSDGRCYTRSDYQSFTGPLSSTRGRGDDSRNRANRNLQAAGFVAFAEQRPGLGGKVISALVAQADEPSTDFAGSQWCQLEGQAADAPFMLAVGLVQKTTAYDYAKAYATTEQRRKVEQWLAGAVDFLQGNVGGRNREMWRDPYDDDFSDPAMSNPVTDAPIYQGGPRATRYVERYNNRIGQSVAAMSYGAALVVDAQAQREAEAWSKAAIVASLGDRFWGEHYRGATGKAWKAISYTLKTVSDITLVTALDVARWDGSMLHWTTTDELGVTQGAGRRGVRRLLVVLADIDAGRVTLRVAGSGERIRFDMGGNTDGDEAMFSMANRHYGDVRVRASWVGGLNGATGPWGAFVAPGLQFGP